MPVLMTRFLAEVAQVPLVDARDAVIDIMRHQAVYRFESGRPAGIAGQVFRDVGDSFLVVSAARMYLAAAAGSERKNGWKQVVICFST
ncbi:hypothetical protein [Bradyrhizobium cenepequi]|uniref:hypothetical protein n=1 Tax=Bradyrhizobium cenepequi TaxID=2821403 RepID=UPI001CE30082|nr:hypothetical protein [Bradyrhizobium cenepequi]MCA6112968.1 hypothetical protein [Bradyrhizobium cenepequi]